MRHHTGVHLQEADFQYWRFYLINILCNIHWQFCPCAFTNSQETRTGRWRMATLFCFRTQTLNSECTGGTSQWVTEALNALLSLAVGSKVP